MSNTPTIMASFFRWIVTHPKRIILAGLIIMIGLGSFLPSLEKDTRSDAFLADDNPALLYRDQVKDIFGLSDPIVIAVVADTGDSIFTIKGLNTIQEITNTVLRLANVDPQGVTSLASENNIYGTEDGMEVEPFYEGVIRTQNQADKVRDAIRNFPLYQGTLVSKDETASLIVAEILDESLVEETYQSILANLEDLELPEGIKLYVAGEGAIAGYLGSYIDSDAKRLNPLAAVVITIIILIAFRSLTATLLANVIVAASALTTLGAMSASGVPFFVITNALPVILIGIAVADSIHIYSEYFERQARFPNESINDSIVASMLGMWRPITLTSLTTSAGFMGLYAAAYMPPFKFFGLFTAFGVSMAWIYSLIFLPAAMSLAKTKVRPSLARQLSSDKPDAFAQAMTVLGRVTMNNAGMVVAFTVVTIALGLFSASKLVVNEDRIDTFHSDEPLYQADQIINARFDGSNYLDIVIETPEIEGIFDPEVLQKIDALQNYAETLPHVNGSVSVVDYLKQMNRSLNEGKADQYRLPEDKDLVAQYFLLYSTAGEPTDFEEEVDFDYRLANVRIMLNEGAYALNKDVVEALDDYIVSQFNTDTLHANLSGRVNLNYHWIKDLGPSHFFGMGIALLLVWLVSSLLFRSATAGFYALIPVATSILFVYTTMVLFSIPLGVGTSMFAAVAIGLGVDFATHTIDRIRSLYQQHQSIETSLLKFYPSTGRALFFNLLALALGFGVLISSKVVPLNNFGTIVALSVTTSFLVSMTLLPAMIMLFKPKFITGSASNKTSLSIPNSASVLGIAVLAIGVFVGTSQEARAEVLPDGRWVAEQINAVNEGETRISTITMILTDRRGKERIRETIAYRKFYGDEKRTALFYLSPKNIKNTGFLTYDYPESNKDDDQWLYLPALRKTRRISASDRGDYFLGTDLTYEDMKKEGKFEIDDYRFKTVAREQMNGADVLVLESVPVSDDIAQETGYQKVRSWVDESNWIIVKAEYWDTNLNHLKTLNTGDIRLVNDIWTRHNLTIVNHKTGHKTEWKISEVSYTRAITDGLFQRNALTRGVPK